MDSSYNCSDSLVLYKCKTCQLSTNEKIHYRFHNCKIKSVAIYEKNWCNRCIVSSYSMLWIFSHQIRHNAIENCKNYFTSKTISTTFLDRKFKCDQCVFSTNRKNHLKYHFNTKHASDGNLMWYNCEKCNWKGEFFRSLRKHVAEKHSDEKKIYQCDACHYKTSARNSIRRHKLVKHTSDYLITWHNCKICSYRGKHKDYLSQHMKRSHPNDDLYKSSDEITWFSCNICNYRSKSRYNLKYHSKTIHSKELSRKYKCRECPFEARFRCYLEDHMISKHTPDNCIKWNKCSICNFKAKRRPALNRHIRLIHKPKPAEKVNWFTCQICNSSFKLFANLRRHMASHHTTDLNCFECKYTADDFIILRKHLKNQHFYFGRLFNCEKCLFEADKKVTLEQHINEKHIVN